MVDSVLRPSDGADLGGCYADVSATPWAREGNRAAGSTTAVPHYGLLLLGPEREPLATLTASSGGYIAFYVGMRQSG